MPLDQQPSLRPADVVVALSLALVPEQSYGELSQRLHLSRAAAHGGVKRLQAATLLLPGSRLANRPSLRDFLLFGVRYAFYAVPGPITRGVATAHSAPPLRDEFSTDDVVVWPSPEGQTRGQSLVPLYPGAPLLSRTDPELYVLLAMIDTLRIGQARERDRAREWITRRVAGEP
jgi:hypothetical protein